MSALTATSSAKTLLVLSTGEPYQPVRLKWRVPSKSWCVARLRRLRCVAEDGRAKLLTVFLTEEAERCNFGLSAAVRPAANFVVPPGEHVILGTIRFPDDRHLMLHVRSIGRAIELARLFRPVLGAEPELIRGRVINRWFEASESAQGLDRLDKLLDANVTVIDWEKTADEMDAVVARGRTPEERLSILKAWREQRDHDVPLVEDFPCHPEDERDDMRDIAALLTFRFLRAGRVWSGERVTLRQVIEEAIADSHRA